MISDDAGVDSTPVIHGIPLPELHLMTGPVNTMFNGLEAVDDVKSDDNPIYGDFYYVRYKGIMESMCSLSVDFDSLCYL